MILSKGFAHLWCPLFFVTYQLSIYYYSLIAKRELDHATRMCELMKRRNQE